MYSSRLSVGRPTLSSVRKDSLHRVEPDETEPQEGTTVLVRNSSRNSDHSCNNEATICQVENQSIAERKLLVDSVPRSETNRAEDRKLGKKN